MFCYIFNIHPRTKRLAISSDSVGRSNSNNKNAKTAPINHTPPIADDECKQNGQQKRVV